MDVHLIKLASGVLMAQHGMNHCNHVITCLKYVRMVDVKVNKAYKWMNTITSNHHQHNHHSPAIKIAHHHPWILLSPLQTPLCHRLNNLVIHSLAVQKVHPVLHQTPRVLAHLRIPLVNNHLRPPIIMETLHKHLQHHRLAHRIAITMKIQILKTPVPVRKIITTTIKTQIISNLPQAQILEVLIQTLKTLALIPKIPKTTIPIPKTPIIRKLLQIRTQIQTIPIQILKILVPVLKILKVTTIVKMQIINSLLRIPMQILEILTHKTLPIAITNSLRTLKIPIQIHKILKTLLLATINNQQVLKTKVLIAQIHSSLRIPKIQTTRIQIKIIISNKVQISQVQIIPNLQILRTIITTPMSNKVHPIRILPLLRIKILILSLVNHQLSTA